jgi:hypothetical protein
MLIFLLMLLNKKDSVIIWLQSSDVGGSVER